MSFLVAALIFGLDSIVEASFTPVHHCVGQGGMGLG